MSDGSVKVAVRVRPFNNREKQEGAVLCIEMKGQMTRVYSPELEKKFFFDYSYWSHDSFVEDPDSGMMVPDGPSSIYADQKKVYSDLGVGVLNNAFEGYHCCLFAYGQTGSGKSYSMVGYGKNKGIIPIVCEEIFKRIEAVESKTLRCEVTASMLEIYNEQIQDLLKPPSDRVKGGLKIREDPKEGVYVQDLSKIPCSNYDEISDVLDKGNNNRTVAATQMNATSSRAHTVLTICFTQIVYDENGKPFNRKVSNINLVDLAGSERASKTGASGDTLKEGSNINKSLSTLGRVITALAKKSSGSKEVVPYRESSLTRILSNALGGNSKTTMIAAISPATFNIEETISTLRYADQVKSIKNQAVVNETPQEKLIRELKEENERLKAMLEGKPIPGIASDNSEAAENARLEYERQIEELRRAKEEAEKNWKERISGDTGEKKPAKARQAPVKIVLNTPHLTNLNEDPLLSGHICHGFKPGKNTIGKKNPNSPPGILIEGLGIGIDHCVIEQTDETYKIFPSQDPSLKTSLNGKLLTAPATLEHQDRIKFGNYNFFLFVDPEELSSEKYDWEYAVKEASEEEVKQLLGKQDEELKAKEDELKRKLEAELEESKKKFEEEKLQLEQLMSKKGNDEASRKALEEKEKILMEQRRLHMEEMRKKEEEIKSHEANRIGLEALKKELTKAIQKINEINERAVLLEKNVYYKPEIYFGVGGLSKGFERTKVRVSVTYPDMSEDFKIYWSLEKLDARLVDIQDICNQLEYGADMDEINIDYDPFTDTTDSISNTFSLIGHAYVYLEPAYYFSSIEDDSLAIINDQGGIKGTLHAVVSVDVLDTQLEEHENLKELLGKEMVLTIKIVGAKNLPNNFANNAFCQYTMNALNDQVYKTTMFEGHEKNPSFNYVDQHKFNITSDCAEEFLSRALIISVFGDLSKEKKEFELSKIAKANTKKSIKLNPGITIKNFKELDDEEFSVDGIGEARSAEVPNAGFLSPYVNNGNNLSALSMSVNMGNPGQSNEIKKILEQKNKEIKQAEEEFNRKMKEEENEIEKRLKAIEKAEKKKASGKKGSSFCMTF